MKIEEIRKALIGKKVVSVEQLRLRAIIFTFDDGSTLGIDDSEDYLTQVWVNNKSVF